MRKHPDEVVEQAEKDRVDWYGNRFRNYPEEHIELMEEQWKRSNNG